MSLSSIKAVIFDWAGTAVDYGCCAPAGVFVEVFSRYGVDVTSAEAREPMGQHKRDHIAAVLAMPRIAAQWRTAHGSDPSESDTDRLYAEAIPLQLECLPRFATPIPGMLDLACRLAAAGVPIGSTTGYNTEMLATLAAESARAGYCPAVRVSADEVPKGRPAPYMCWEALMRLGAWPAHAAVKVGDTPSDMRAGRNGGLWTIGVTLTGNEVGLTEAQLCELPFSERRRLVGRARRRLMDAGAHQVVDGVHALLPTLLDVARRIERGSRP